MVLIKKIRKIVQRVVYYDMREEDIKKIEDTIYNITEGKWYIKDDKVSEFIASYTKELEGKKYIDAVGAINELYTRIIVLQNAIKDIHIALSDYGSAGIDFDKRLMELEGKKTIHIVSESDAKIILK